MQYLARHLARRLSALTSSGSNRGGSLRPFDLRRLPSTRGRRDGYQHFGRGPYNTSRSFYFIAGGITLFGGGYYLSHLERAPYTGRRRMIAMSREQEVALGIAAYEELLTGEQVLSETHPSSLRVRGVGVRIAREVKRQRPELLKGFKWRFAVIHAPGLVNAVCAPGGRVVVYSGLLDLTYGDDDQLAAVLAHEIAHAVQRHSAERLSAMRFLFSIQALINLVFDFGGITHLVGHLLLSLPYSRTLELEADAVGLQLMTDACYDPAAAPRMFEALSEDQLMGDKESRAKNMLSTHPLFEDRIKALEKDLPEVSSRYRAKCQARVDQWRSAARSFNY